MCRFQNGQRLYVCAPVYASNAQHPHLCLDGRSARTQPEPQDENNRQPGILKALRQALKALYRRLRRRGNRTANADLEAQLQHPAAFFSSAEMAEPALFPAHGVPIPLPDFGPRGIMEAWWLLRLHDDDKEESEVEAASPTSSLGVWGGPAYGDGKYRGVLRCMNPDQ
ncbi:hypothetical protein W97_05317 [Coniosporium apollinis CBS 100218]|uniref:Uncharacterized protein n=1 Tax=Coniosporium apollinis (strain CBS 100218) TaxID=1168221 RepID=R7YW93_CONA1|nr:uncharacterized protein W97_05317 [Coniosporium apollinis CBS 100218]EON66074.1 hypothetical protein W97_05317 [Coniosporium apollinis CBS 100218]